MIIRVYVAPPTGCFWPLPSTRWERISRNGMPTVTLKAHYDGERILLDEPFEIPLNCPLMVTVLAASEGAAGDWLSAAQRALSRAYGDEPEYTAADLKR